MTEDLEVPIREEGAVGPRKELGWEGEEENNRSLLPERQYRCSKRAKKPPDRWEYGGK